MNFSKRSDQRELLDEKHIPAPDIQRNLFELAIINKNLGGHNITWKGFTTLAKKGIVNHVCEIGCGGGDNLKLIEKRAEGKFKISISGVDINPECIHVAKAAGWSVPNSFVVQDYKTFRFNSKPDILFSSLFCHHFLDDELVDMFLWMKENCKCGFFINDLHRHPAAYHAIGILTKLFSRSYLVQNDAPLSVLRGFKKNELENLLNKAGIHRYSIRWKWAFRWLIIVPA